MSLFEQEYSIPENCRIITDKSTGSMYVLSYNDSSHDYDAIKLKDLNILSDIVNNINDLYTIIINTIIPLYRNRRGKLFMNAVNSYALPDLIRDIYSTNLDDTVYKTIVLNALNSPQAYLNSYESIKDKIKKAQDLKKQLDEQLDKRCKVSFLSQNTNVNTDIETDTNISTNTASDNIGMSDMFSDFLN